jgi:hypothetical protein
VLFCLRLEVLFGERGRPSSRERASQAASELRVKGIELDGVEVEGEREVSNREPESARVDLGVVCVRGIRRLGA